MTDNALATQTQANIIESVVIGGDLSKLTPEQRVSYYQAVCKSLSLNPLTKPFDYINLNGKLTLYARKDCADQLRKNNNISLGVPDIRFEDDWIIVSIQASDDDGRTDSDVGVVSKKDMRGDFGNALMKAVTKAKRRVTLSICGLGMLDETEVETIPDARPVVVRETGEIIDSHATPLPAGKSNGNPADRPPSEAGWAAWKNMTARAEALDMVLPTVPENVTAQQLKAMYAELKDGVEAIESFDKAADEVVA
jgi:hypothetical protein